MTKLRQFALYSCAMNDAPVRGAGVLLAVRVRSVSQSLLSPSTSKVGRREGREGRTWKCCRLQGRTRQYNA